MKTTIFQGMKIRIDRPKGFVQKGTDEAGKAWERTYAFDYGYLPKTEGGDGEGIDVFLGPDPEADEAYWVCQMKQKDGDEVFDEYKVFLGFPTKAEAKKAYFQHIPRKYYGSTITMKVPLMKAMLGVDPAPKMAFDVGFVSGLSRRKAAGW
jgi:hypothetical protein